MSPVHWILVAVGVLALAGVGLFIKFVLLRPKRSYESILGDALRRHGLALKEWREASTGETGPFGAFNVVPIGMSTRTHFLVVTATSSDGSAHEVWARVTFLFYDKFVGDLKWKPELWELVKNPFSGR